MKILIYITGLLISFSTLAQTPYETEMTKALDLWEARNETEAVQLFERISSVEPEEWLPSFYASQIITYSSFGLKDKDGVTLKLDKALELLNTAKNNSSENNAELLVLEAQYYTAWIAFDGMTYGMKYAGKIGELYQKAITLAPDNPRVVLGKAEWDMGTAAYFGGDVKAVCSDVEKAITLFETFKPVSSIHPSGGLKHAEEVLAKSCK